MTEQSGTIRMADDAQRKKGGLGETNEKGQAVGEGFEGEIRNNRLVGQRKGREKSGWVNKRVLG